MVKVRDGSISRCSFGGNVNGADCCGGICGHASNAMVSDCKNTGSVNGSGASGGICGGFGANLENCGVFRCKNNGKIQCKISSTLGSGGAGGICGSLQGLIADCVNEGKVINSTNSFYGAGGITGLIGDFAGDPGVVEYCRNQGEIISSQNAAGICSEFCAGEIRNSYNSGDIADGEETVYSGGVVGFLAEVGSSSRTISDCFFLNSSCDKGAMDSDDANIVGCETENLPTVVTQLGDHFIYKDR